jgi:hypothetical protein
MIIFFFLFFKNRVRNSMDPDGFNTQKYDHAAQHTPIDSAQYDGSQLCTHANKQNNVRLV